MQSIHGFPGRSVAAGREAWFRERPASTETGLILCGLRYYDPSEGRWLTRDPLGYDGGVNLYGYVGNNPVNAVDPEGTNPIVAALPWAGGLAMADGPVLPFGDMAGATLLGGAAIATVCVTAWDYFHPVSGDKGEAKRKKHNKELKDGLDRIKDLNEQLRKARKHVDKQRIRELLEKELKKCKGHDKEINEKWKTGRIFK